MRRREFLGALGCATIALPLAASAQPQRKIARIEILSTLKTSDLVGPEPSAPANNAFLRGLHELGYVFGEHFVTEPRGSEGKVEQFGVLASELVREQVDDRCRRTSAGRAAAGQHDYPRRYGRCRGPRRLGAHQEPRATGHK